MCVLGVCGLCVCVCVCVCGGGDGGGGGDWEAKGGGREKKRTLPCCIFFQLCSVLPQSTAITMLVNRRSVTKVVRHLQGLSEQLLVRLANQNRCREMYSPMRRNTRKQ